VRPLERDLERVLVDLAEDFPLLAWLVEARPGGQKKLAIGGERSAEGQAFVAASVATVQEPLGEAGHRPAPLESIEAEGQAEPPTPARESEPALAGTPLPGGDGARRPIRYGLAIQFEARPGDRELGRLVESTVFVNEAHPAYRRAVASRSEGYHIALAVALSLAPLAAEKATEHAFVTAFLSRWGEALQRPKAAGRRAR
jgi:hypothetical protein